MNAIEGRVITVRNVKPAACVEVSALTACCSRSVTSMRWYSADADADADADANADAGAFIWRACAATLGLFSSGYWRVGDA